MSAVMRDERDVAQLRVPPQAIDAEQNVLGGLMLAPEALWRVMNILSAEDFYRESHRLIWQGITELADRRQPFDAVTLGDWFGAKGLAELVEGGAYLIELASTTWSSANIAAYAEIVRDKAVLRRLIEVGTGIVNDGFQPEGRDTAELLADAQQALIGMQPKQRGGLQPAKDSLGDWFTDLRHRYELGDVVTGLPTPWLELNKATHGLQKGELVLVPARPSMGKSIKVNNIALFTALRGHHVAQFSLEMTKRQNHRRNISALSGVPHDWLLSPQGGEDEYWNRVQVAIQDIKRANLSIDDTSYLTIAQLMARARMLHMKHPIELLVVDHIHDFKINAKEARFEYGKIAQGLKTLAKEFDCPVVAAAQLNRNLGQRADKRPNMTDLRESGELEQKADLILFLHREDYYDQNTHLKGVVEVIVAKGRDIEAGKTVYLKNDYAHMALRDWEGPIPFAPTQSTKAAKRADRWGMQSHD